MLARDARLKKVMGQVDWFANCKLSSKPCKNGGFTMNDCSCACPLGTTGANCEKLDLSYTTGVTTRADGSVLVGDMLYSAAQWQSLLARNLKSKEVLWPKTSGVVKLPYKIADPKINATLVKLGISAWESTTCLKFPELSAADTTAEYLNMMIEKSCWSGVGYTQGELTNISIAGDACNLRGIIHELGHAMGLEHEQSRSDRDDNIIVVTANIAPGDEANFNKENTVNFGLPYDYYSVMQYQDAAGSKGPERVMLARDPRFQTVMGANGDGSEITFMNLKLVNTMYGCIVQAVI
ncbi:embryonic protein UVS.2-like [Hyalella azteca]|uniref:Metalloendopeptidase n=1 Tax=Hyalella azteca TaxID=294128 RepID=A0A979FGW7_HYAAZ|nr:embryonic protein UVS.2-like [Hyalella azteca]